MNERYLIAAIFLMSVATFLTRAFPFICFRKKSDHPLLNYIGLYFPLSAMVLLVLYCVKDFGFREVPYAIPEIFSAAVVAALHYWRKNVLLSVGLGMALYLVLVRTDFLFSLLK